ncbi:MAG: aminotransferase class V-fold PLP-dependent enzyme [Chitinophagaceae bacterium]|nr:aminotransferase class V-fold PLP-dependent enzyme [Polaromonas sp.]
MLNGEQNARSNFPINLYIAVALCTQRGLTLELHDADQMDQLVGALTPQVAVLMLTHVNYRTGTMHDMATVMQAAHAAHAAGVLTVWDLAHSASAVPDYLTNAHAIMQALIARGVIGDFRAGSGDGHHLDILHFGFTPLDIGFKDLWHGVKDLRQVLSTGEWQQPEFR